MSHHLEKVQSTLARAIQQVISQGLHDPRAGGLISVTKVDVAPDMANAMVFVSVFPEEKEDLTMHALRHAAKHIRHQAAELVAIRRMPAIEFRLDKSLKHQAEVYQALAKTKPADPAPSPDQANTSDPAATRETPPGRKDRPD